MPSWAIEFLATAGPEDPTSGLSRTVWSLAAALQERGHRVRVLYPDSAVAAPPPYHGVECVPVPLVGASRRPFGRDIAIARNASSLLDPRADIIVGNDEKAGALDLRQSRRARFGMMVHDVSLHTFDTLRPLEPDRGLRQRVGNWLDRGALRRLEGKALKQARFIVVASSLNRSLLQQYYGLDPARVDLIPDGVADPIPVGTREECRLALKVPPDVPVVAFIGRTPERQGLPVALETFRRVRVFFPGSRFLVVGSTPPTEPGVVPLGVVDETTKARVLTAADVFLFPSLYEGYGLAPREAMRYGVASVVSAHVPMDGIPVGPAVRVVASDTAADYAADLAELLADPALRRQVGEAGRKAADEFSFGRMAERFEAVFSRSAA